MHLSYLRLGARCCLLLWAWSAAALSAEAQALLRVGTGFDAQGKLLGRDTVFSLQGSSRVLAGKIIYSVPLRSDTYFVFLKMGQQVLGRFYAKRSKAGLEANFLCKVSRPGIYRLLVYNPKDWRRLVAKLPLYITDAQMPTVAALRMARTSSSPSASPSEAEPDEAGELDLGLGSAAEEGPPSTQDIDATLEQVADSELEADRKLEELPEGLAVAESEFQAAFTNSEQLEREVNIDLDRF